MAKRCYYEILEVTREADDETLKKAYRKLAMKYHPDRNPGDDEADAQFKEASEAFQVLSDPQKRDLYNRYGHAGLDGMPSPGSADNIMDIFGDILGDLFGGGGRRRRGPRQGGDVRHDLEIDLVEAYRGAKKDIKVGRHERCSNCHGSGCKPGTKPTACRRCNGHGVVIQGQGFFRIQQTCNACRGQGSTIADPCGACRGSGAVRVERELTLTVPAGVDNDMRLAVEGEGESGQPGAPPGDLIVFLKVRPHPLFVRNGQNLHCEVPITFPQAALGTTLEVPTLEGKPATVTVKRGTQPGEEIRLHGKGMPHVQTGRRGDLVVHLRVMTPRNLTKRQEELLHELAELDGQHVTPERKGFFDRVREFFASAAGSNNETKPS